MFGQKNIIVFLVACAFALYQFRNAKNKADLMSPDFQMKKAKQMIINHMNMFDHKIYDAKTGRGDFEILIMTNEKGGKAPQLLGRLTEDKSARRARRHGRRSGHDYRRKKRKKPNSRRRRGRKERQEHIFTPTLRLVKYDEKLTKLEYVLIRRGLITNVLNAKAKETLKEGNAVNAPKTTAEEKEQKESIKADTIKEIEKRTAEKEAEETRKSNEQAKKTKEQTRKQNKREEVKKQNEASDDDTTVVVDTDGNMEKVANTEDDSK
jgi:hypothetical protein